jgi:hypothetical protein
MGNSSNGERVARGPNGRTMRRKNNGWFWSDEVEAQFFDHLAASGNVRAAAEAVGFCTPTVYRLRRQRPDFAARWQEALEQGYAKLEMALLLAANLSMEGEEFADLPIPKMTVEQAMNVLRAHRNAVEGDGRRGPGRLPRRRSLDEVRGSILKKVEAIRAMDEEDVPEMSFPSAAREPCSPSAAREPCSAPAEREGPGEGTSSDSVLGGQALPRPLPQAGGEQEEAGGEQEDAGGEREEGEGS